MRELPVFQHKVLTATVKTSFSSGLFFLKQFVLTPAQTIKNRKKARCRAFLRQVALKISLLADGQEGSPLVFIIADDPLGQRVQRGDAIHKELIAVMSVMQRNLDRPESIRFAGHRMNGRIPLVEIAHQTDRLGLRSSYREIMCLY